MNEFTFVTISYNHEKYMIEHLESIRYLIEEYGQSMSFDFILGDDCSRDATVAVVKEWIGAHRDLFRNVTIIDRKENIGTINNLFDSMSVCKTHYCKLLAGDDKYYRNNIFKMLEENDEKLVLTPILPFGGSVSFSGQAQTYKFLYGDQKHIGKWLHYRNLILAPGVFIPVSVWRDQGLRDFLAPYKYIEDYPMWCYLFHIKKMEYRMLAEPYICYRMNSGISRNKKQEKFNAWTQEHDRIVRDMKVLIRDGKKQLNPHWYYFTAMRYYYSHKKSVNRVFSENTDLKQFYT